MTGATLDGRCPLAERVLRAIERDGLIPRGGRVLAALSGGADSVALSVLLAAAAPAGGYALAGLLHVNHQLRGGAAEADESFCRALAGALDVPIFVERVDVAALARADRISIEHAGHRLRYATFERVAGEQRADRVATGHTRDDLAETVLLRLIRGAGPGGLAGIRPRAGRVVRPLLGVSRQELREHLAARGLQYREDESNRDLRVTRNRVRHRLLPLLAREFSPSIVGVLAREAAIARADADWLDGVANERAAVVVSYDEGGADVDAEALRAEPLAVARRIARTALERVSGRGRAGFAHVERLLDLAASPDADVGAHAGRADFPGGRVERRGGRLLLRPAGSGRRSPPPAGGFEYRLDVPGEVAVPEAGVAIAAEPATTMPAPLRARGALVAVDAGGLTPPLAVRSWRPGDAFRPLGLGGRKKLQDFFVDRKVARGARGTVPIVTDRRRGIVWVVGHAPAEDFRVTDGPAGVLILRSRKLGGLG
ncbi:MAG: tRNA lysidine(34) synthetase TilS [Acidobacteria bacterium]|nr:tRNA lysidine(34) synthetase TilS [Acidobacteriota bacterium]